MADISEVTVIEEKEDGTIVTTTTYDIKDEIAREQLNAIPDGTYPDMTVGGVMSSDGSTDSTPYLYRVSGGGVEVGTVEEDSIVGGTVAWNQLAQNGNFVDESVWQAGGSSSISVSNGEATVTIGSNWNNDIRQTQKTIGNHVYFAKFSVKSDSTTAFHVSFSQTGSAGANATFARSGLTTQQFTEAVGISKPSNDVDIIRLVRVESGADAIGEKFTIKSVMLIDLTQMFGTSVADYIYSLERSSTGAGIAFFRSLFPNDYYEYNTGELKSVEGLQSHDMVGFNQWDEELETGAYNTSTGAKSSSTAGRIRSANYISCKPNTAYYVAKPPVDAVLFYGSEKEYIGYTTTLNVVITPNECHYMTFYSVTNYGATYKNDICISISSDRNGEYEPYVKHSYPLDSSLTLRGIPKLSDGLYFDGDTYEADGTVTRKYGVVDLGTLNWSFDSTNNVFQSQALVKTGTEGTPIICDRYVARPYGYNGSYSTEDKIIYVHAGSGSLRVRDSSYTDAATFKTAMSGVMLVYELATQTEETAQAYTEYQKVSKYGTEEYVSTGIVPVGHVTKYPTDIVSKVNGLPSDFSTLIAPTETGFKATRAYSVNQFIIVNNQLYRVTSAIASGATITVGTNVTATTVADILTALLNA